MMDEYVTNEPHVTTYAVQVDVRYVVEADSPEQALAWLNDSDQDLPVRCYGHAQRAVLVDQPHTLRALQRHDLEAYRAALGDLPQRFQWLPMPLPARAFAPRLLPSTPRRPGALMSPARAARS